jgi:uncharacterized membrane protein
VLQHLLQALQDSAVATAIREGESLFPWIESVHVLAVTLVIGSIAIVDLRLLGLASRDRSVLQMTTLALPVTWTAFVIAVISGSLMFSSNALAYARNPFLQAKLLLIIGAGANMAIYHLYAGRGARAWLTPALTPRSARIAGAISLALWIAVAACGRWIGFTLHAMR